MIGIILIVLSVMNLFLFAMILVIIEKLKGVEYQLKKIYEELGFDNYSGDFYALTRISNDMKYTNKRIDQLPSNKLKAAKLQVQIVKSMIEDLEENS